LGPYSLSYFNDLNPFNGVFSGTNFWEKLKNDRLSQKILGL